MASIERERRKFPRIPVELFVRYKILSSPQAELEAKTKNISGGGACLVTRERLNSGTIVAMEIKFPRSKKPILTRGRVIWSDKSRHGPSPAGHERFDNGVEFEQISDSDRQRIIEHVNNERKKMETEGWKVGIVRNLPEK